jgi:integrase/recombinase XerD
VVLDNSKENFLSHLSVEKGASKNTLSAYRRDLDAFEEFLATEKNLSLENANSDNVSEYVASLRSHGLRESSIARKLVAIRSLYRFRSRESGIVDIGKEISVPRIPKRLPKALTVSEIARLIDANSNDGNGIRDRALIELLYSSGSRISELIALNINDISTHEEGVSTLLVRGKGGKDRLIPIGSFAKKALEDYVVRVRPELAAKKSSPALFLNRQGGRLSRQSAWKIVLDAARRAGIESVVSPHALRHSFATHLIDGGADIRVVQELLGHSSVTTTQIYTLVTIDKLRESFASAHPRAR